MTGVVTKVRKNPVDYSGFSLKKINEQKYAHIKLLAGWIVYFVMYFLTENLIPVSRCHEIYCSLDDLIPFNEFFVLFYVGWYFFVAGSLAYTFFYDVEDFKKIQQYIMFTQAVAMLCYILYPSVQNLRPLVFPRNNIFTYIIGLLYAFDTPTGVCPSLHVAYSIGILSVTMRNRSIRRSIKVLTLVFVITVCAAVCFIKQHSIIDVFAALLVCSVAEFVVFRRNGVETVNY